MSGCVKTVFITAIPAAKLRATRYPGRASQGRKAFNREGRKDLAKFAEKIFVPGFEFLRDGRFVCALSGISSCSLLAALSEFLRVLCGICLRPSRLKSLRLEAFPL